MPTSDVGYTQVPTEQGFSVDSKQFAQLIASEIVSQQQAAKQDEETVRRLLLESHVG